MTISDILHANMQLMNEIFGQDMFHIDAPTANSASIKTGWMELKLVYGPRDLFVSSTVRPMMVPAALSEPLVTDTALRFLDIEVGARRKSCLDDSQVVDELNRLRPLVNLLQDEASSRDAANFVKGYDEAYTDHCRGLW